MIRRYCPNGLNTLSISRSSARQDKKSKVTTTDKIIGTCHCHTFLRFVNQPGDVRTTKKDNVKRNVNNYIKTKRMRSRLDFLKLNLDVLLVDNELVVNCQNISFFIAEYDYVNQLHFQDTHFFFRLNYGDRCSSTPKGVNMLSTKS